MGKFKQLKEKYAEKLQLYVPVVDRVHGQTHPEFHDVYKIYTEINEKIKTTEADKLILTEEFKQLRKITDNYTVPDDTCESYEAVYQMLAELDEAYHKED